ncbi:MAG: fibronectin type III domain-containing protein [Clostridia bacterium]|jgi:hypothetical protein|nr:fibronectin type III domain-containing protein [Clostridia bacterium]
MSNAGEDPAPHDIIVSNVTSSSLTISWITDKAVNGYVIPVLNGTEQNPVLDKRGDGKRKSHYVVLKSLEPSTKYSFTIVSDEEKYTKGSSGVYEFTTAPVMENTPVPSYALGTIAGSNFKDAVVYITLEDKSSYPVSVDVPESGNWTVELSLLRGIENNKTVAITDNTNLVVIARNSTDEGAVLKGSYSTLFDKSGQLKNDLILETVQPTDIIAYFPDKALLGKTVYAEPVPPEPEEPEEPKVPVIPISGTQLEEVYIVRNDVPWEDLSGVNTGSFVLTTGEDSVIIANLTDISVVIAWRSSEKEEGYVKYGTSKTNLNNEMIDSRDTLTTKGKYYSHYVSSDRLSPNTTYYFEIHSGNKVYDKSGSKYSFTTFSTLSTAPALDMRTGKVINASDPSDWIAVFKIIDNDSKGTSGSSGYIATLPDEKGSWTLVVGDARSADGSSYFVFSDDDILQGSFLGAIDKKFDFNIAQEDIQLDVNSLSSGSSSKVNLLSNYGIVGIE